MIMRGGEGEGIEVDLSYDGKSGGSSIRILPQEESLGIAEFEDLNLSIIRKAVSFSNIKVRTYPICIGDNPACSDGLPLAMDWHYLKEYNFSVDYYERKLEKWADDPSSPFQPGRYPRKSEEQLRIPANDRLRLLWEAGFKPQETNRMARSVNMDRKRRQASIRTLKGLPLLYFLETVRRATSNATIRRAAKRREREFLKPYKKQQTSESPSFKEYSFLSSNHLHTFDNKSLLHRHHGRSHHTITRTGSADTASVETSTPTSFLSYNGDLLFPPSPITGSPLAKTIRGRKLNIVSPRAIDMAGQVKSSNIDSDETSTHLRRSPTIKRKNHHQQGKEEEEEDELLRDYDNHDFSMDKARYSAHGMDGYGKQ